MRMCSRQERGAFGRGVRGVFVCKGPMKEEPAFSLYPYICMWPVLEGEVVCICMCIWGKALKGVTV